MVEVAYFNSGANESFDPEQVKACNRDAYCFKQARGAL